MVRLAWISDSPYYDSSTARESRVLLPALAACENIEPLWIARGFERFPQGWRNVRLFPFPIPLQNNPEFLSTILNQLRPELVVTDLQSEQIASSFSCLANHEFCWWHRLGCGDSPENLPFQPQAILSGDELNGNGLWTSFRLPHIRGLSAAGEQGDDPVNVVERLRELILSHQSEPFSPEERRAHLVMRQHLYCNTSVAHAMFELTNALLELGIPTVAQDEHLSLSRAYIQREEHLFQKGCPEKYQRVLQSVYRRFDPENAFTVHFTLAGTPAPPLMQHGIFSTLYGDEILYITGNHTVDRREVQQLANRFRAVLAPSTHVIAPYWEAGLSRQQGFVVPHGIDPTEFNPDSEPIAYPTEKRFKFIQSSFPWIFEKGYDLTVKAFSQAFSAKDDAVLVLRIPVLQGISRDAYKRLEQIVTETIGKPNAPEISLLECDVPPGQRGGVYTGADCYVHPLRAEGFGMTILEAMACGLPTIATPWSGPADFLQPDNSFILHHAQPVPERTKKGRINRYHVEPDFDHLVHLMRYVYENRDEAKAVGAYASKIVRRDWTWKRAAEKLARIFHMN